MTPELSIVIPSHRRVDLLRACLASVRRHAPAGTEVIVVDDASEGGAVSRAAAEFGEIRLVRRSRRDGFCAAANDGIRAARGAVVELLNDDTEVTTGWAEAALATFADARVGAVAPLVLWWPGGGVEARVDSAGDRYFLGGVASKRGHGRAAAGTFTRRERVFGASGSSAFYRRSALEHVGGFPESFGAYFEDVDLSFRLHRAGYEVVFEPSSRVLHHVSSSYGPPARRLLERQSCNEELVFWRNVPGRALWRALPLHLAVLAAKAQRRWGEGQLRPFVTGRLRALGELPTVLRHRRQLRSLGVGRPPEEWCVEGDAQAYLAGGLPELGSGSGVEKRETTDLTRPPRRPP